jgi:hypothetical protein
MSASNYAGCGCTALTSSYGKPSFVPSRPRGFGVEDVEKKPDGLTDTQRYVGIGLCFLFIGLVHVAAGGFSPPPAYRVPRSTAPPRQYYLPR